MYWAIDGRKLTMTKPNNNVPKKGFYLCTLNCPSRGPIRTAVKITRGKIVDYMGTKQDPSLLSNFSNIATPLYVKYFPADAAKELIALRKLVTKLKRQRYNAGLL